MINLNDYLTTITNNYNKIQEILTNEDKENQDSKTKQLLSFLNSLFDDKLMDSLDKAEEMLNGSSISDIHKMLFNLYTYLYKEHGWNQVIEPIYVLDTLLNGFYKENDLLSKKELMDLLDKFNNNKYLFTDKDEQDKLINLFTCYKDPDNLVINLYNEVSINKLIKVNKKDLPKQLMTIEEERKKIEIVKDYEDKKIDDLFLEEKETIQDILDENIDLKGTVKKLIDQTTGLKDWSDLDITIDRVIEIYFSEMKDELLTMQFSYSYLQIFFHLIAREYVKESSEETTVDQGDTTKDVKIDEGDNFNETAVDQGDILKETTVDQENAFKETTMANDYLLQENRIILKNLKSIFQAYCKRQLAKTCIKTTFNEYGQEINSLKLVEFLSLCNEYNMHISSDAKKNRNELISLFKLMSDSHGLRFIKLKKIIKHLVLKDKEQDNLTEETKEKLFFDYLMEKGFDDKNKIKDIKQKPKGFVNTIDGYHLFELNEKRKESLAKNESIAKIKNREKIEKRINKKVNQLKNSPYVQNHINRTNEKLAHTRAISKENRLSKTKRGGNKQIQAKLPYKKIDSYFERAQIMKQRNLINTIEWNELAHMKPNEISKAFGANPDDVMPNTPDL